MMGRMNLDNFGEELGKAIAEQNRQEELAELDLEIGQRFAELVDLINKEQEIRNGSTGD